jgi:hypothetical protein
MAENITNENGELMYICTKCDKWQHNSYKISYVALYFSNYMISILSIHPTHEILLIDWHRFTHWQKTFGL